MFRLLGFLLPALLSIITMGALGSELAAEGETISWASGSPTSPENGWIQGAGTFALDPKKTFLIGGIIMTAKKGSTTKGAGGEFNVDNKTWQSLLTGLDAGEWTVTVTLMVTYNDFSKGEAKTEEKKITVK